ncbi:MAG: hydrogenase subunit MbhD domain-containing protein, partial [Pseudolabrys sp.]
MTLVFACEVVLAGLLVAIATWTIVARTAFAAIVVFMVYGLLLAIVWVALSAVDVALTEAAIGGGVTSIVLLGAASRLRGSKAAIPSVSFPFKITAGVLCAVVSATLMEKVVLLLALVGVW